MKAANARKKAKACSRCGGAGPFAKSKTEKSGLQCWCKGCHKQDASLEELELLVRNLRKAFRAGKENHS